jgi:hypothetical protein
MEGGKIKTEHGEFNTSHVRSFLTASRFIEDCVNILNHLPQEEKERFLRQLWEGLPPEKNTSYQEKIKKTTKKK